MSGATNNVVQADPPLTEEAPAQEAETEPGRLVISEHDLNGASEVVAPPPVTVGQDAPAKRKLRPRLPVGKGKARATALVPAIPSSERSWARRHMGKIALIAGGVIALAVGFIVAFVVLG